MMKDWREELEQDVFPIGIWHDHPTGYAWRLNYMQEFIQRLVDEAIKKERETCRQIVANSRTIQEGYGVGVRENAARDQAMIDLSLNLLD